MAKAPTVTVRPALEEDLPAVVGIYNWAVNQTFATIDSEPLSREEAHEWWQDAKRSPLLVADLGDDGVAGWARLFPWRQRGFDIVEDLVYVDPLHHKAGIGRELLAQLVEAARELGYRTIVASLAADNRAGLRLHESLGFGVVGTLKDAAYKFERWMDITLVQRSLE
ncbi:MAG TPA: GNAT family N-acetyltransferase [Candidatus Dormibacteraeota bacterium]